MLQWAEYSTSADIETNVAAGLIARGPVTMYKLFNCRLLIRLENKLRPLLCGWLHGVQLGAAETSVLHFGIETGSSYSYAHACTWSSVAAGIHVILTKPIVPETEIVALQVFICSLFCSWCCIWRDCPWPFCCSSQTTRPCQYLSSFVNWLDILTFVGDPDLCTFFKSLVCQLMTLSVLMVIL